jgi:hypothetical protein
MECINHYLTIIVFASRTSLHPNTIRRLIKIGKLNAIDMGTAGKKIYRIPESEIERMGKINLKEVLKNVREEDLDVK